MPKVFSDEKRQEIRQQLMDTGLELLKQFGLKKLAIETVTKRVGIAQGTFYSFFPSKEMLVYALGERYQERLNDRVKSIVDVKGSLDRDDIYSLYVDMMLRDEDNVFRYLTREDMQVLVTRLPRELLEVMLERNLRYVKDARQDVDTSAVINWIQLMNLTLQNQDMLLKPGVEKIVCRLIDNMLDEIF